MSRNILVVLAVCLLLVIVSNVAYSDTEKSGNVSEETGVDNTYLVTDGLTVDDATIPVQSASPPTIWYEVTDLTDTIPGEDLWQYTYHVSDYTFPEGYGFTIYFDVNLYNDIEEPPPDVNDDWDVIVWQPDPNIPDDGAYDALSLTSKVDGASLDDAFPVSFVWLGIERPGSQSFKVYQKEPFDILESGQTIPILPGDVSGDNTVNAYDAALILQRVVGLIVKFPLEVMIGSPTTKPIGDVSGNGIITAYDVVLVLQRTVGLIKQFPVQAAPALIAQNEDQLLNKAIAGLENSSLSTEQKRVLEQLKRFCCQKILPEQTALLPNYPNPFNPETWIPYALAESAVVTIQIYNAQGYLIRSFELGERAAGVYTARTDATYWDGRNQLGESVSSGLYYYTIHADDFTATRKMLLVK